MSKESKSKRNSFENFPNPYDEPESRVNDAKEYESLVDAMVLHPSDFDIILATIDGEHDNASRIRRLHDLKTPYLFTSEQLVALLEITPSIKTRIAFVDEIGPRLTNPKSLSVTICDMFRYSEDKKTSESG